MSATTPIVWKILIIEDDPAIAKQLEEAAPGFVDPPNSIEPDVCDTFEEATKRLKVERYDIIVLDLKDDSGGWTASEEESAGLKVFEELKKTRFTPVVFYTALAHKVRLEQTSFVRVVEKTETVSRVKEEVRRVLDTHLPSLNRAIDEIQRSYMWDFVSRHWKDFDTPQEQADVAYLLARRMAIALEAAASGLAVQVGGTPEALTEIGKAHPMIMYIAPPLSPHPLAGDIVLESVGSNETYWLILTPSCDFAQRKADHITMAKCERLVDRAEHKKWVEKSDESNTQKLEQLIEDKRGDRFKFLPRAFFLPDLVVDFQQLRCISLDAMKGLKPIATLDSPFAESVLARFSRYFGRLGTPDIDKNVVIKRLKASQTKVPVLAPATKKA